MCVGGGEGVGGGIINTVGAGMYCSCGTRKTLLPLSLCICLVSRNNMQELLVQKPQLWDQKDTAFGLDVCATVSYLGLLDHKPFPCLLFPYTRKNHHHQQQKHRPSLAHAHCQSNRTWTVWTKCFQRNMGLARCGSSCWGTQVCNAYMHTFSATESLVSQCRLLDKFHSPRPSHRQTYSVRVRILLTFTANATRRRLLGKFHSPLPSYWQTYSVTVRQLQTFTAKGTTCRLLDKFHSPRPFHRQTYSVRVRLLLTFTANATRHRLLGKFHSPLPSYRQTYSVRVRLLLTFTASATRCTLTQSYSCSQRRPRCGWQWTCLGHGNGEPCLRDLQNTFTAYCLHRFQVTDFIKCVVWATYKFTWSATNHHSMLLYRLQMTTNLYHVMWSEITILCTPLSCCVSCALHKRLTYLLQSSQHMLQATDHYQSEQCHMWSETTILCAQLSKHVSCSLCTPYKFTWSPTNTIITAHATGYRWLYIPTFTMSCYAPKWQYSAHHSHHMHYIQDYLIYYKHHSTSFRLHMAANVNSVMWSEITILCSFSDPEPSTLHWKLAGVYQINIYTVPHCLHAATSATCMHVLCNAVRAIQALVL